MARIAVSLALACGATAAAQSPDAQSIVDAAAESMLSVRSATYEAQLEVRGGEAWRVATGRVQLARFDFSDPIGGKVAVQSEITRWDAPGSEVVQAVYDGEWMRQFRPQAGVLLEGQLGYGGAELLRGSFGDLILRDLVSPQPLASQRRAPSLRWLRRAAAGDVPCDVVEIRFGDDDGYEEWWFGAEDRLPRMLRRRFRSAQGGEVESLLTLADLQVNTDLGPAAFRIDAPDDVTVEMVGRKPPPDLKIGDPVPEWTVTGSDGKRHRLSDYRGKLVVLDFWASWCPYCRQAMPAIQKIHDTYGERGVAVLAFNCRDRGGVDPVAYVRDQGFSYFVADGNRAAIQYSVGPLPYFYVISPTGRLLHRMSGYNAERERELIGVIEKHLPR
jgi:thiol-disulfide isomerase/thioredoxin